MMNWENRERYERMQKGTRNRRRTRETYFAQTIASYLNRKVFTNHNYDSDIRGYCTLNKYD